MERYHVNFIFPPHDWFMLIVLSIGGIYLWFVGLRFLSNIKSGLTLLYLGSQPIALFKLLPGLVKRQHAEEKFNVYGYAYISPTKCVVYGVFFWLGALIMILLNFVSITSLGR